MKISSFSKTYDKQTVLSVPELELIPGKIYAIIGANGSGKSTFSKILAGVLRSDQKADPCPSVCVGYLPQTPYAFRMSTRKNLLLCKSDHALADHLMEGLQIKHLADKRADKLSGGETARMALARLMMKSFDLVILDEPTAAMDMESTVLSEQLIRSYVSTSGCTLILVTHSLSQAKRMADEILYFHKGVLLERNSREVFFTHPTNPETRQFLEFYGDSLSIQPDEELRSEIPSQARNK